MGTTRRTTPARTDATTTTTPTNGAAANGSGSNGASHGAAAEGTRRKPPGPKRPWSVRLAEQEARLQKIKDEGRRDAIAKHGENDLVTQTIWKKLRLINKAALVLREMGLSDESCIAANTELEQALNERLNALQVDPSIAVPMPKKEKTEGATTSATTPETGSNKADENDLGFP